MSYNFRFLSLAGAGHTNPQLPLVAKLIARGHRISYICTAEFRKNIEATGATWVENTYIIGGVRGDVP